ncbi:hypothetical protein ACFXPY_15660 [Streptomyces sp. NPDC059153]|uniref:hypothetical protein n=1 Tax=Streptomyces sp. NPDC059153 TaxID=3346743 RepID=UPI0036C4410A
MDREQRIFARGNSEVRAAAVDESGVGLEGGGKSMPRTWWWTVRTWWVSRPGFRDLGPNPHQEPYPALLGGVIGRFRFDVDGYVTVEPDYRLRPHADSTPLLFLSGLCESSHGIGDAGSFSLLPLRAATILGGLCKQGTA